MQQEQIAVAKNLQEQAALMKQQEQAALMKSQQEQAALMIQQEQATLMKSQQEQAALMKQQEQAALMKQHEKAALMKHYQQVATAKQSQDRKPNEETGKLVNVKARQQVAAQLQEKQSEAAALSATPAEDATCNEHTTGPAAAEEEKHDQSEGSLVQAREAVSSGMEEGNVASGGSANTINQVAKQQAKIYAQIKADKERRQQEEDQSLHGLQHSDVL